MKKERLKIIVRGAVQGVGFRPFIFRLAEELGIAGYVLNSPIGVIIEAEASHEILESFLLRIESDKPRIAHIAGIESTWLDSAGFEKFEIRESEKSDEISALVMPDIALCKDCERELFDPADRRYLYPFINCTNCGPRYSIIEELPYDRPATSMKIFEMCRDCRREYEDPSDRRFHAQPVACPNCGPHVYLTDRAGNILSERKDAIEQTAAHIEAGKIIALKGLGGFQLLADPANEAAVTELRKRKNREQKPFALMAPSLEYVKSYCFVQPMEERLLTSPEAPIVLLRKKEENVLAANVAPENPYLGVMLPYTPLHRILMDRIGEFVIATSGNISEEPMCRDNDEALRKLGGIADNFLMHNRPIVRSVDDSIVRVVRGKELVLRRARGYAPFPVFVNNEIEEATLAVGGHLKNTIALGFSDKVFISQHIGDLSTADSLKAFENTIADLQKMYAQNPDLVIHDLHPDYLSTKYAAKISGKTKAVQHHLAHAAACKAENQLAGTALAVSWDGTGLGLDNTIWGGEFFMLDEECYSHTGQFRKFPLPGGEAAIREPRRSLLGALFELFGEAAFENSRLTKLFSSGELSTLKQALRKGINSPMTSSAGRLFDAVSALLDFVRVNNYEGQAGMMLEFKSEIVRDSSYGFDVDFNGIFVVDWAEIFKGMLSDFKNLSTARIAGKFHNTLAKVILEISRKMNAQRVLFTGGCFQNMILTELAADLLESEGIRVYTHQRIPPNDGGISLGQIAGRNLRQVNINHFIKGG